MKLLLAILPGLIPVFLFAQNKPTYKEPYRPQFHFTPHHNWMNDPNGLVYYNGEYHLFYQYNPMGNTWGHMSWGHAVSANLINWQHLPLAIPEDEKNMIFSGSCVVDKNNTSGFAEKPGQVPMVAIYTAHKPDNSLQNQHLAYSLDNGRTWKKYEGNPILDLNKRDFRDPKVFWHTLTKKWIMVVMLPNEHMAKFYGSPDLKTWSHLSDFGPAGDVRGVWECPDLLQVPIVGQPGKSKWVLLTSQQSSMQYFVGEFDGSQFRNENPADTILRPDYGPDFYAGITYNNLPTGHDPVLIAWASNPGYAQATPTSPWRSAMSVPRSIRLKKAGNTWTLLQQPAKQLQTLRGPVIELKNKLVTNEPVFIGKGQVIELDAELLPAQNANCGVWLATGGGQSVIIGYDAATEQLYIDRSNSGNTSFDNQFAATKYTSARVLLQEGKLRLHILFDKSIVEVFANDGATVITAQVFPTNGHDNIEFFSEKGSMRISTAKLWSLNTAWK